MRRRSMRSHTLNIAAVLTLLAGGAVHAQPEGTAGLNISAGVTPVDAVGFVECAQPLAGNACLHVSCPNCSTSYSPSGTTSSWNLTDAQIKAKTGFSQCTILDVNAGLHIDQSPIGGIGGVAIEHGVKQEFLWAPSGPCNANSIDAIFDDESGNAANSCPPTNAKVMRPVDALSNFDGLAVDGTWALDINDNSGNGLLQAWGMAIDAHCDIVTTPPTNCHPSATTLCLQNDRFEVKASWQSATGSGVGTAVSLTADTGYFWFFDSANVEAVVKVLNGCGVNSRYWVFAGGLTNVKVTLSVKDTKNGQLRQYVNQLNTAFKPIQDVNALATCP